MSLPYTENNPQTETEPIPELDVQVDVVPFGISETDDLARFSEPDVQGSVFTDYVVRNRFEKDMRRYMLGITSPNGFQGDSVAFVQLAAPTLLWIADWTACRWNSPPPIPDPESVIGDWVLLAVMPETGAVTVGPDGRTGLYRISGTYIYGNRRPNANVYRNVNFPRMPWLDDSLDRSVPENSLQPNIIDGTGGGSSSNGAFPGTPGPLNVPGDYGGNAVPTGN